MDFAETKTSIILFIYDKELDTSLINLIDPKSLYVSPSLSVKLYKEVTHIQNITVSNKCTELVLIKEIPGKWYGLSGPEKKKKKEKKVIKIKEEEPEETDIMKVLSRIYENGDEDTKRAMEKSFIESEGTVLSTNWEEVKDQQNKKL